MTAQAPWEQSPDNIGTALAICVPSVYRLYLLLPSAILCSQFGSPTFVDTRGSPPLNRIDSPGDLCAQLPLNASDFLRLRRDSTLRRENGRESIPGNVSRNKNTNRCETAASPSDRKLGSTS